MSGALRRLHAEGLLPPNPKGWILRRRRTRHIVRPPGRTCRKSPGVFVLSLSHSMECTAVPRDPASLNANAVGESTTAGDLEAAPSNASGRVDPQRGSWNLLTMSSQRVSPYNRQSKAPQETRDHPSPLLTNWTSCPHTTSATVGGGSISETKVVYLIDCSSSGKPTTPKMRDNLRNHSKHLLNKRT